MSATEFSSVHTRKISPCTPEDEKILFALGEKMPLAKHRVNLKPFNFPFAMKARILLQSYLEGIDLNTRFSNDLKHILAMCPVLWEHLINICSEMMAYYKLQSSQHFTTHRYIHFYYFRSYISHLIFSVLCQSSL